MIFEFIRKKIFRMRIFSAFFLQFVYKTFLDFLSEFYTANPMIQRPFKYMLEIKDLE